MDLVELQLREQKQSQGGNPLSQNELRLLYGIALIRFVNLMGDSLQSGYFAKSLYVIAQEIGLPQYFVQLRHAATHEELPSLVVLRQASIQALRWLDNNYWSAQIREDALTTVNEESLKTMSELITEYKEKRKAYLKKQTTDGNLSYMKYIKKLIPMLSSDILQESIIDLLLKNGGLVPTAKKKRPSPQDNSLSKGLIMLWQPLLQELDKEFPNFATGIISAILDRIDDGANFMVDYSLCDPTTPIVSYL
ncbi:Las1-like-domain-containing protein [Chlamydoabsidia padenii]|nr:Las1-like-domain-containing protein [Chlamydoabsidia padenii]